MDILELALRIAVSATFLLSAAGKAVTPGPSAEMVAQLLALRGRHLARVLAAAIIAGEAAAAALVASADSGIRADLAAGIALALCALFTAAAIRARTSGRQIACRCFGSLRPTEMLGPRTLRRALPRPPPWWPGTRRSRKPRSPRSGCRTGLRSPPRPAPSSPPCWGGRTGAGAFRTVGSPTRPPEGDHRTIAGTLESPEWKG